MATTHTGTGPGTPAGRTHDLATGLAFLATDLETASRDLARRLKALGQERAEARKTLREDLRLRAAAEAQHWEEAAAATAEVTSQLADWLVRRDERAERLAADAAAIRKSVGLLAGEAVSDAERLAGQLAAASREAGGRWHALDVRVDGIGDFLHLLAREQRAIQEQLATLSGLLVRQQEARNRIRAAAVQDNAAAASGEGSRALQRGDLRLAENLFRRAWTLDGTACSKYNLALVLLLSDQHARAAELLAGSDPSDADPVAKQSLLALQAYRDGDFDRARREAEAGLAVDPGHGMLRQLAAAAAARCGATAEALRLSGDWPSVLDSWTVRPHAGSPEAQDSNPGGVPMAPGVSSRPSDRNGPG